MFFFSFTGSVFFDFDEELEMIVFEVGFDEDGDFEEDDDFDEDDDLEEGMEGRGEEGGEDEVSRAVEEEEVKVEVKEEEEEEEEDLFTLVVGLFGLFLHILMRIKKNE